MDENTYKQPIHLCEYHICWATKYRRKILKDDIRSYLHELLEACCSLDGIRLQAMEIMPNYVYLRLYVDPKLSLQKTVHYLKYTTASKLKERFPELKSKVAIWTRAYFVQSIGSEELPCNQIQAFLEAQTHTWRKQTKSPPA